MKYSQNKNSKILIEGIVYGGFPRTQNKTFLREDVGIEDAASHVHDAWMSRRSEGEKQSQAHLMVPYEKLPEEEKEKDREHIRIVGDLFAKNPIQQGESTEEHHERIANLFGSLAHESFLEKLPHSERYNPDGSFKERMRGERGNVNLPWHQLNDKAKEENLLAGRAAVAAHVMHIR
jgi:hypothetical protein